MSCYYYSGCCRCHGSSSYPRRAASSHSTLRCKGLGVEASTRKGVQLERYICVCRSPSSWHTSRIYRYEHQQFDRTHITFHHHLRPIETRSLKLSAVTPLMQTVLLYIIHLAVFHTVAIITIPFILLNLRQQLKLIWLPYHPYYHPSLSRPP